MDRSRPFSGNFRLQEAIIAKQSQRVKAEVAREMPRELSRIWLRIVLVLNILIIGSLFYDLANSVIA